jgi:hypothetical protein
VDEGYLDNSPIKRLKKPPVNRRDVVLAPEQQKAIYAAARGQCFKDSSSQCKRRDAGLVKRPRSQPRWLISKMESGSLKSTRRDTRQVGHDSCTSRLRWLSCARLKHRPSKRWDSSGPGSTGSNCGST